MFLDIMSNIFIFVAIHLMIVFLMKSYIAVIKTDFQSFDFKFILLYSIGFFVIEYFMLLAYSKYILN